jgi:putative peptidoglycan lipid II flippase
MGQARWLCAGAVAGGVLQLLIPMWGLQQAGWKSHPVHADEKAWSALRIAFVPAALGAGILQINFLISRSLAFNVDGAGLTYYYIANRIVELPIGLFSTSIATVMFPAMATAFAQNNSDALSRNYARGMRLILAINIAAAVGFVVFSREIVQVLFEFGKFKAEDCENTRLVLCLFALAMPFHAMISMVTRALNVIGNTTATFRVALQSVSVNVVASVFVVWKGYGIEGLACANAAAAMVQYALLRMELKKSAPYILAESLWKPCGQTILGSLVMGVIAYQIFHFVNPLFHRWDILNSKIALFIAMSIAAAVAATVYAGILYWWKYPERDMMTDALNKVKQRLGIRTDA